MRVIDSQMRHRNLSINSVVYEYLFKNYSLDLKLLLATLSDLDKASLQAKMAISVAFVRKFLNLHNH